MKKIAMFLAMATLLVFPLAGCGGKKTLKVGATPAPHAEVLQSIQEEMANRGVEMEIVEFTDYPLINQALANGDIDANYFQHEPYLVDFNEKNGTDLKTAAYIHYEPLALFPGKTKAIADLKEGAQIGVPNDATNEARALLLLQDQGLIKLKEGADLNATKLDIVENPKNFEIMEIDAAQLARSLQDLDMAVINGNYALQAGLNAKTDGLAMETEDSLAGKTYANIVAVRNGDENREEIKTLIEVLTSDQVKAFMEEKYQGSVVPVF